MATVADDRDDFSIETQGGSEAGGRTFSFRWPGMRLLTFILFMAILFAGKPDLMDAIISRIIQPQAQEATE